MLDLSCPDWEQRLAEGRSLIPDLPLVESEAEFGLSIFDELELPDVPGHLTMREAAGPWFRDLTRVAFGSWDPIAQVRCIRDIFLLAPKAQSKTTYQGGLMLTAMVMNKRPNAEALFVGPTQSIADRAYDQAAGMIEASPALQKRFHPQDHLKTITDRLNKSEMLVKTFALNILTGSILIMALVDELHILGNSPHTTKVLEQIRGGLDKTPEGLLLITTTQSDDVPAGAFKEELNLARRIRDGQYRGKIMRPMLPVLFEFPTDIAAKREKWADPANWPMIMPNLGRSAHLTDLVPAWETAKTKGEHAIRVWASQYLNVEIGTGLRTDSWAGAEYWEQAGDAGLTLDAVIARSEVVVVGADGGGLDDLFGLCVLGRERGTRRWLAWCHAWCHAGVLKRRQSEAARLRDFEAAGELTIYASAELGRDIAELVEIVVRIDKAGLLAFVGLDPVGIGGVVDALAEADIGGEDREGSGKRSRVVAVSQGWKLTGAIKTTERKLVDGTLVHAGQAIMNYCVGNARTEPRGNALIVTKQASGTAKIDPLMALYNTVALMSENPEAPDGGVYTPERGLILLDA